MILLLGNMLFATHSALPMRQMPVFMAEDQGLCTHFPYHKHKLILVLAAMRHHRDRLKAQGITVEYWELGTSDPTLTYEDKLLRTLRQFNATEIHTYTIEDHWMRDRLEAFCALHHLKLIFYETPLFLTSHTQFQEYRQRYKRLFMGEFYKFQRRRLNLLLDDQGQPLGGQWSYDSQNRKPLPKKEKIQIPALTLPQPTAHVKAVAKLVDHHFADHPGSSDNFWLPVTSTDAQAWLNQFLEERFANFGPYEDALSSTEPFVYHSVLSPLLNLGLLTPKVVVDAALTYAANHHIPLNSLEGFLRQVVGWREYIRGVYHTYPTQRQHNRLGHTRQLTADWQYGTTGLPPVDQTIERVKTRGWAHHIERLMIMSNVMLLAQVHPDAVFAWFMTYFVDSADWVMVPNVYGMGQFADGGQIMTKPYISGSNYLQKMGNYPKGDWSDVWDGLYWRFVAQHQTQLQQNPRLSIAIASLGKMSETHRQHIFAKAEDWIRSKTIENTIA
ncbi:MAG TPA: cryptochrome/photolyase family protein [Stenomitos sp.]